MKNWTAGNIHFCQTPNETVDLGRPYLSANFPLPKDTGDLDDGKRDIVEEEEEEEHVAPSLLAFGILLLELETGKSIDSFWTPGDLTNGKENSYSNISAASRLVEPSKVWSANDGIRNAAEACINRTFLTTDSEAGATELGFQQAVYLNIVAPIERDLLAISGLTARELDSERYSTDFEFQSSSYEMRNLVTCRGNGKEKASDFSYERFQHVVREMTIYEEDSSSAESPTGGERIIESRIMMGSEPHTTPPGAQHAKKILQEA